MWLWITPFSFLGLGFPIFKMRQLGRLVSKGPFRSRMIQLVFLSGVAWLQDRLLILSKLSLPGQEQRREDPFS